MERSDQAALPGAGKYGQGDGRVDDVRQWLKDDGFRSFERKRRDVV